MPDDTYGFYIVEDMLVVRVDRQTGNAELYRGGTWEPYEDVEDVVMHGRRCTKEMALAFKGGL